MKLSEIIKTIALAGFLLFLHDKSFKDNYFNYDSIPYVASAYMLSDRNLKESHAYAWNLLKEKSHPSVFNDLCCKTSYRKSMFNSSNAFGSHLPAYQTKSLYVYSIRLVSDVFNTDEFLALKWISFASVVIMVLVIAAFLFQANIMIYLSIFPIFFLMQVIPIARLLTPDGLNALFMVCAGIGFLTKRKIFSYFLLLASILIRQTNIIFFGIFLFFELRAGNYAKFFLLLLVGLLLYGINAYYFESIGYWRTFQSSLIRMPDSFVNFNPEFEISTFFSTLVAKIDWMLGDAQLNRLLSLFFLLFFISIYHLENIEVERRNNALVPLIFISCSILSFALIPFPDFRIYSGHLIATAVTLLFSLSNKVKE